MNTLQIDFFVGAVVGLLYMLYVLVRVLSMRDTSWLLKLLISVPVLIFPIGGALLIHVLLCAISPEPRDDRFLGILGSAGALAALLTYGSTFAHFAVQDVYAFCYILLGVAAFLVLCSFLVRVGSAFGRGGMAWVLSMFPKRAVLLAGLTVVNAVFHIGLWYEFAEDGVPREKSGRYYLSFEEGDRPEAGREISKEEYYAFSGHFVRATSSVLLAFFLVPAFFFLLRKPGGPPARPER